MNPQHAVKGALSGKETDHPEAANKRNPSETETEREDATRRSKVDWTCFPVHSDNDPKYTAAIEVSIYGASVAVKLHQKVFVMGKEVEYCGVITSQRPHVCGFQASSSHFLLNNLNRILKQNISLCC